VISGSVPPGLTLTTGGVLSGTPTATGSSTFTVQATDADGCLGVRTYTIVINPANCVPIVFTSSATLPSGTSGTPYSQQITATGGTGGITYTVTFGTLPPGLTLSSGGLISGTPTQPGGYTFTVTATDSVGCENSSIDTILINCPVITLSPNKLDDILRGNPYSTTITASGGTAPYSFAISSGSLPPGLTLSSNGTLSGTSNVIGNYAFTVTVTDAAGCQDTRAYSLSPRTGGSGGPTLDAVGLTILVLLLAIAGVVLVNRFTL
jgi:hypothetical protein